LVLSFSAWAEEAVVSEAPEVPRNAIWLHTSVVNLTAAPGLGYERWFSPSISLELALSGTVTRNWTSFGSSVGGLGAQGSIGTSPSNSYGVFTEVQLRWHSKWGAFVGESLSAGLGGNFIPGTSSAGHSYQASEAVLLGWGHSFSTGLRVELYAGPQLALLWNDAGFFQSTTAMIGLRAGLGVGYAF
jgi:hypothetical protein